MGASKSKAAAAAMSLPGVATPVPSAAVVLIAPTGEYDLGFKVLLMKRHSMMKFMPNTYVFPGGKVEGADEALALNNDEVPDVISHGPHRVCALREMLEEVGVVMDRQGNLHSSRYARFCPASARLLVPMAHWITPIQEKKRFDTFFFGILGRAELNTMPLTPQEGEVSDLKWLTPQEALDLHADANSGVDLPPPQYLMLHKLAQFKSAIPVMHEHQLAYGMVMNTEMPRIMPICRVDDTGVLEMHFAKNVLHLTEGVHEFPGLPPVARTIAGPDAPLQRTWRVRIGEASDLINPRTNRPFDSIPESKVYR